ncbi:DUF6183 family protein [Paenibacillus flagellatus]|uniref:Uncharacterized protein n=1 Tax=Paenibacillus flagellatus TaxID=2211139 RepID=A0A2V5KPN9_9BACL|nr:DUF6183 family protein [Paenibacillus flagellatus]PYI57480.1 hypothetical protein DLM86_03340 [Paenibacillus flagellatus]
MKEKSDQAGERQEFERFRQKLTELAESGYQESVTGELYGIAKRWSERGDGGLLLRSVEWAEAHVRPSDPRHWNQVNHVLDRLDLYAVQLAAESDALAWVVRLLTERRGADSAFPRNAALYDLPYFMAVIADNRPSDELHRLLDRAAGNERVPFEASALLLCEMAVRGKADESHAAVRRIREKLQEAGHPLSRLPLRVTMLERDLPLRLYGPDGSGGHSTPFGPIRRAGKTDREAARGLAERTAIMPAAFRSIHTAEEAERMEAAVRNWRERSNGRSEAAVFEFADRFEPEHVTPGLLLRLGLASLHGAAPETVLLRPLPADRMFVFLYGAAANGGAYSSGGHNAYGRLDAWRSAMALAGVPDDADIPSAIERIEGCHWSYFEAPTPWFRQVAWDVGIVALRPDGRTLAVLAATDTD